MWTVNARKTSQAARTSAKAGFTLLELAIVMVIIGLMIGGVLTGQALIQQAKINKMMTDIQKFVTAVQTFQGKYNALPGDMSNATKYWGAAGSPTNTWAGCYSIAGIGTQTCDGNGDGQIALAGGIYAEQYRAWQHLQLAGLIEGSYTGVTGASGGTGVNGIPGVNIPKGPWNNSGYEVYFFGNQAGEATPYAWAPINFGHVIMFGGVGGGGWPLFSLLTTADMLSVDLKYDDGMPFSGIISTPGTPAGGFDVNCATTPSTAISTYNLTYSGPACGLIYVSGF